MAAAPSSSSYLATAGKIAGAVAGVAALATVGYAAYFDYKRRNDPVFRKKLYREHKKLEKKVKQSEEVGKGQVQAALRRAIALVNAEKPPATAEEKEQFFMEQVALGEQLAARSPEFYVASAISFYKALKVYPAPQELLMIYQKTQPQPVFDLVMELISLEINDQAVEAATRARAAQAAGTTKEPLLQEVEGGAAEKDGEDEDEEEEIVVGSSSSAAPAAAPASVNSDSEACPSSGSSFVHVESDAVVTPSGDVAAEETTAVVADAEAVEKLAEEVVEAAAAVEEKGEVDPPEPSLAA
ncbi:hypothetical protein JCM6882_005856 [Rhodosporidiobolus microsporus]